MKAQNLLKAYVDGELGERTSREVEAAIQKEANLAKEAEQCRQLSKLLGETHKTFEVRGMELTLEAVKAAKNAVPGTAGTGAAPVWKPKKQWAYGALGVLCLALAFAIIPPFLKGGRHEMSSADFQQAAMSEATKSVASPAMPLSEVNAGGDMAASAAPSASGSADAFARSKNLERAASPARPIPQPIAPGKPPYLAPPVRTYNFGRQLTRTADIQLTGPDPTDLERKCENVATSLGGYVEQSGVNPAWSQLSIRVPAMNYDAALTQLRNLATVVNESSTSQDITGAVVDVQARLRVLRAQEADFVDLLRQTRNVSTILEVRDRLAEVRTEIEQLTGQAAAMKQQVDLCTIRISIFKQGQVRHADPKPRAGWIGSAFGDAGNGLIGVAKTFGGIIIYAFVFIPIWAPLLLIAVWAYRQFNPAYRK